MVYISFKSKFKLLFKFCKILFISFSILQNCSIFFSFNSISSDIIKKIILFNKIQQHLFFSFTLMLNFISLIKSFSLSSLNINFSIFCINLSFLSLKIVLEYSNILIILTICSIFDSIHKILAQTILDILFLLSLIIFVSSLNFNFNNISIVL